MVPQKMQWCLSFAHRRSFSIPILSLRLFIIYAENSLVRCSKCKTPVKDTDAVLDAVRVGQEALDKAEALQFSSACSSDLFIKMI